MKLRLRREQRRINLSLQLGRGMGYGMALLLTMFRSVLTQLLAGLYPKLSRGVHYVRQKFEFRVNR